MHFNFGTLKKSTKALLVFFLFNMTLAQWEIIRTFVVTHVFPLLVYHSRITAVISSILGAALTLHRPGMQKFLHDTFDSQPDVPAEPGAKMDNVVIKTEQEP